MSKKPCSNVQRVARKRLKRMTKTWKFGQAYKWAEEHKKKPTASEKAFEKKLRKQKLKVKSQKFFVRGDCFAIVDFYIPARKLCIEVDGGYHNTVEQQAKDVARDAKLVEEYRVQIVRITNEKANVMTVADIEAIIEQSRLIQ